MIILVIMPIFVLLCSIDLAPSEGRNIFVSGVSAFKHSANTIQFFFFFAYIADYLSKPVSHATKSKIILK